MHIMTMGNTYNNDNLHVGESKRAHDVTLTTSNAPHIGNSVYKVVFFTDTLSSGYVDRTISCCDVRLTKLKYNNNGVIINYTSRLEIIPQSIATTPYICAECGDWKTYYKKCN